MIKIKRPIIQDNYYFITSVTYERKSWFENCENAQILVDQLRYYEKAYEFNLDAYCVLPDHYHAILNVGFKQTISQILHAVHSYTATRINEELGRDVKLKIWKGNAWDEVIRNEEMYWQKVAYTLFNPWRSGLVEDPMENYPFSNLFEWYEREGEDFLVDLLSRYKRWYE